MSNLKLHSIRCFLNDETDADEIYLKYNGQKVWPLSFFKSIHSGDMEKLGITLRHENPNSPVVIEVWDYDFLSSNDLLGKFELFIGHETSGRFQTQMKPTQDRDTASYLLDWEILN